MKTRNAVIDEWVEEEFDEGYGSRLSSGIEVRVEVPKFICRF
jgi:hypothetical protein